ncbi:hypothetical protein [Gilliamella sp. Pas-s95]|uniref:hypothetical protein n=1 Tax=Gilliamella sp. Pas-s95 TaxID=2687317 RepID=UPI0013216B81|nr:hypothetical protein [Gilliamella sp. Pas-s95]MWN06653.1 hypothetical protein [Gilliamella sp. Pas-s95]
MASGIWHLACQTYALNLFQFHRSRNQTQFLFLSPKLSNSLRLARSSGCSSWLGFLLSSLSFSNFSILLKLPSLLRSFSLPRLSLFFVLLLSYTQSSVALTAHTSRVIEGTLPYLMFDGGWTKVTDTDSLLSIKLQDDRVITPSTNPSSVTNPIILPYVESNLSHIAMVVPSSQSSISINDLVVQGNWGDDDGDGQGANGVTASGNISVSFTDKDGNTVNRNDALSICNAPYRVTLSSSGGYLQTQYGVPNRTSFSGQTVTYYISPYGGPVVCHTRPNLSYGTDGFTGPSNIWSLTKGFLSQSNDSLSYDQNFPTTGADGLYFDLLIGGVDGSQLTWSPVTRGGITATVTSVAANDRWIPGVDKEKVVARVTLSGPRADSTQIGSDNPSPLTPLPSLPQTFELVGRDSRDNVVVKYGFVLKQWFVHRGNKDASQSDQISWCNRLGYRAPQVKDLTNAVCSGWHSGFWCRGAVGATPSSSNNHYKRHIGAGFFTEWGILYRYADAGFVDNIYWTSDVSGGNSFTVAWDLGDINSFSAGYSLYGLCTTP